MTLFSNKVTFQVCGLGLGHLLRDRVQTIAVSLRVIVLPSAFGMEYVSGCSVLVDHLNF